MKLVDKKTAFSTRIFDIEELLIDDKNALPTSMYRLVCSDWANVLPITSDHKAILIKQPRAGALKTILETPGGMVDANERDPTIAAHRELEEETGFTTQRILSLGSFNPNPALMSNRIHFFLALGCYLNPSRQHFPDASEQIDVQLVDVKTLNQLVRTGQIDHALSALCILLASKYLDIGT